LTTGVSGGGIQTDGTAQNRRKTPQVPIKGEFLGRGTREQQLGKERETPHGGSSRDGQDRGGIDTKNGEEFRVQMKRTRERRIGRKMGTGASDRLPSPEVQKTFEVDVRRGRLLGEKLQNIFGHLRKQEVEKVFGQKKKKSQAPAKKNQIPIKAKK